MLSFAVGFIVDNQREMGLPNLVRVGRGGSAKTRPFDRLRDLRLDVPTGNAYSSPGWARWPGRHGGGASAKCGRPLMSALIFRVLFIKKKEEGESQYAGDGGSSPP